MAAPHFGDFYNSPVFNQAPQHISHSDDHPFGQAGKVTFTESRRLGPVQMTV